MTAALPIETKLEPIRDHLSVEDTAKELGCTATRVRQMILEGNKFRTVRTLGSKPTYLIPQGEVTRLKRTLDARRR